MMKIIIIWGNVNAAGEPEETEKSAEKEEEKYHSEVLDIIQRLKRN